MSEYDDKRLLAELAESAPVVPLPDVDRLWARRRLEEEFDRRRQAVRPLVWLNVSVRCAAGFAAAAILTWLS